LILAYVLQTEQSEFANTYANFFRKTFERWEEENREVAKGWRIALRNTFVNC